MSIQGNFFKSPAIERLITNAQAALAKTKAARDNIYTGQESTPTANVNSTPPGVGNADAIKFFQLMGGYGADKVQAASYQNYFDGNKDGNVTRDELTQSLQTLSDKISNDQAVFLPPPTDMVQSHASATSLSADQLDEGAHTDAMNDMKQALKFGQQLLSQFNKIGGLDGKEDSISRQDLSSLASKYGGIDDGRITDMDFLSVQYSA